MAKVSAVERAKSRLKKLSEKKGGAGEFPFIFLNINDGNNIVRVFPNWEGDEEGEFYKEVLYHRSVGPEGKQMKCPTQQGKPCPVCEKAVIATNKARAAKKAGSGDVDDLFEAARELKARPKFFMNAVCLTHDGPVDSEGEEVKDKPLVLSCGPQVMEGILQQFVDDEADVGGKFWADGSKYDFLIQKSGKKMSTKYVVKPTTKYVDVDTDAFLTNLHNLDELFAEYPSYEELQAVMKGVEYIANKADEDDFEEVEKEEKPTKPLKKKAAPVEEEADEEEVEEEMEEEEAPKKATKAPVKPAKRTMAEEMDEEEPEEEEAEEAPKKKPACFGDADDHNPKDKMCKACAWFGKCAKVVAASKVEEEEAEPEEKEEEESFDEELEAEEAPKKKPAKTLAVEKKLRKAAHVEEDDE